MKNYAIIKPYGRESYPEALLSVIDGIKSFLKAECAAGRSLLYARFFLSDAQNQAAALRGACSAANIPEGNISLIEQHPLDGSRISALVTTVSNPEEYSFCSLRLSDQEAAGKDSYQQTRMLFAKYLDIIGQEGLSLHTHCVRTWIFVRDIDINYSGMVKARNDVFAEEGLTTDTHFIASTGIEGGPEAKQALVAIDFLTCPQIAEADKTYLKGLSHLSPTRDYGVSFERGVRFRDSEGAHIYISGTASIDHKGLILNEGSTPKQTDSLLENIEVLLKEGGAGLEDVPYFVVYLRDISDAAKVDAYMQERFPQVPRVILYARVCRPGWLIEMECEAPCD